MLIIDYKEKYRKQIIQAIVKSLKAGKVVAYPTDTCYGLAADAESVVAVKRLYEIKGRGFNKPVHVIVPSISYSKKLVAWNKSATKLAKEFLPGALTMILPLGKKSSAAFKILSADTGFLGIRYPDNKIALDLANLLGSPITATSANLSGAPDCYSADEITAQFKDQKHKPDIIINAGKLAKRKPSTVVKVFDDVVKILRVGPVSEKQINQMISL